MAFIKFYVKDNVSAQLDGAINNTQASITIKNGQNLPADGATNSVWTITKFNTNGSINKQEKVLVTNKSGNTLTITRGYDGTTATTFDNDDYIFINVTAKVVQDLQDEITRLETAKADKATTLTGYGITNAYTKTEVDNFAVKLTGNQTIAGNKNFTGVTNVNTTETFKDFNVGGNTSGNMGISLQNKGTGGAQITFRDSSGVEKFAQTYMQASNKVLFYNGVSDFMALDLANGRLGIGTISPGKNVSVIGSFNFEDTSGRVDGCYSSGRVLNVSTTVAGTGRDAVFINSIGGGNSRGLIVHDNSSDDSTNALANVVLSNGAANRAAFRVDNSGLGPNSVFVGGKVGIGTPTPEDTLSIQGIVSPQIDNSYTCGKSGFRWSAIWAANGTIQTSDRRQKTDIKETELGLDFISKLNPVSYKWLNGGNIVEKEEIEVEKEVQETQIVEYTEEKIKEKDGKFIKIIEKKTREEKVFDEVDLFDENGNQIFDEKEVEEFEEKETEVEKTEIVDGKAIIKIEIVKNKVPVIEYLDVYDENGNQIFDFIPTTKIIQNEDGEDEEIVEMVQTPRKMQKVKTKIEKIPRKVQVPKMVKKLVKEQKEVIKSKPGSRNHFGFIAQEVEEALGGVDFGGLVIDENGQYALRYDQFISPLVAAVKELKARVEFLESKIK